MMERTNEQAGEKAAGAWRPAGLARLRHRGLQRRRRQRVSGVRGQPGPRGPGRRRHRRQPELSRPSSPPRDRHRRTIRPPARDHPDARNRSTRNTGRTRPTAAISANTSCIRTSRRSPRPVTRSSSTATTPTIAATIARAGRRRASSESAARSTKWISGRTRSASCRGAQGCRRGTSRHPPASRRAFRITPRSRSRSCA